uniref:Polysaccharide biosynthesis protein n=2 Tax=Pseudoalteromonas rubra TaxID=43658 RepID=A0A0F4QWP8_9GAMM|nr:polysaccharide biosynthesis protein [Pseudoalteromonas rubra]
MTSSRLPGKVLLPLGPQSVLETMLSRLAPLKQNIIVATTKDGSETPIIEVCEKRGVKYFRGSTEDVLRRYYEAAKFFGATERDIVVRLTSDCPFIDATLVQAAIHKFKTESYDMVSLGPHSGFPRGLDTCVFPFSLLKLTHQRAISQQDREHVTLGMAKFKSIQIYNISAYKDLSQYRITLDEPDDYTMLSTLFAFFDHKVNFTLEQLFNTLLTQPDITKINQHVEQKTH